MSTEKTWEEKELELIKASCGSVKMVRNKTTGKTIKVLDNNSVVVYDSDGNVIKDFPNLRKAMRFNWSKFYRNT